MEINWGTPITLRGNTTSSTLAAYRPCPVCGSIEWRTVVPYRDFQFYSDSAILPKHHSFDVCQCDRCLAVFTNPCLTPYGFDVLFAEAGQSYGSSPGRFEEQVRWLDDRGLLRDEMTILDVGCSDGGFLLKLPGRLRRIGVDIDRPSIDRALAARGSADAEFHAADFDRFRLDRTVDIITMFHVLEHLPAPRAVLEHLRSVSSRDTRLVIEVPILEQAATSDMNGFFSVHHLTHFSRASLTNLMGTSGWRIIESQVQPDYNGFRVIARPAAPRESIGPGQDDEGALLRYLATWYGALAEVERRVVALRDAPRLLIWGAGIHLEFLYQFTSLFRHRPSREYVVVDSDSMKHGTTWRGIPITSPMVVVSADWNAVKLLVSTHGSQGPVVRAAKEHGVPDNAIVTLYDEIRRY